MSPTTVLAMPSPRSSKFLSTSAAAKLIGVSRDTILRYKEIGLLPYIQAGPHCHHRFRREDVLALVEVKTNTAPPAA